MLILRTYQKLAYMKKEVIKMLKINFKKLSITTTAILGLTVISFQQQKINQLQKSNVRTAAAAKVNDKKLKQGTLYHVDGLSLYISSYKCNNHENLVITTNLKKKQFYQVASNDDKQGKTNGITLAFGNDQK